MQSVMQCLLFTQWYVCACELVLGRERERENTEDNWRKVLPGNPGTRVVLKKYYRFPG